MEDHEKIIRQELELESLRRRQEIERVRHEVELERIQQERELRRARHKAELEKARRGNYDSCDRIWAALTAGMLMVMFGTIGFMMLQIVDLIFRKFFQTTQLLENFLPIYLFGASVVTIFSVIRAWRK